MHRPHFPFKDRHTAGRALAHALHQDYFERPRAVVLGLPRGGIEVAFEVADLLEAPLDVFLVRKLGMPGNEETALGAVAAGGITVINPEIVSALGLSKKKIDEMIEKETAVLHRKEGLYRRERPALDLKGRDVVLVDDGLATGSTMQAAVQAVRNRHPASVAVAVPVAPPEVCNTLSTQVDRFYCLKSPEPFESVGEWYYDFDEIPDEVVMKLLAVSNRGVKPERMREAG